MEHISLHKTCEQRQSNQSSWKVIIKYGRTYISENDKIVLQIEIKVVIS